MIKLLKNAQVYSPATKRKKDVLVIGDKVARIDDSIQGYDGLPEVEVIDLKGKKLLPGYIAFPTPQGLLHRGNLQN